MGPKKNNTTSGVITFHTPFPVNLFKSEEYRADVRDAAGRRGNPSHPSARRTRSPARSPTRSPARSPTTCVRAGPRDEASPSGPQPGAKQDRLSHTSLRRLKAKMEAENQQVKEITQHLLDTENGLVKDLERFLSQRDMTELRRKELLHKRWTERVWFPLQRRVEEHASSCSPAAVKRRQSSYSHYLHHCNTKGCVFLDTYDLREYNPFLLHIRKPHFLKLSTADLKDPLYLQLHERLKEKRTAGSCEAGCKYTRRPVQKLPQSDPPLCESVTSHTNKLLQASSNHPVTATRHTPVGDETEGKKSSRLDTIPYHISATATLDGRCHQTGCWLLRRGCRQQPAS
ncbi:protein FAM228A [Cebidichthys violaceus]|uniref:protein FAM228A n=1 Tax=Cebidichthys violaceus TaxID=271503 RepID=UPI0035CC65F8